MVHPATLARAEGAPPVQRTWGVLPSIAWVAAAMLVRKGVDLLSETDPLKTLIAEHYGWHAVRLLAVWGVELAVIVLAVRLLAAPVAEYLGWTAPRTRHVIFGLAVVTAMHAAEHALAYAAAGQWYDVSDYRQAIAQGMSPWWFVLRSWPAFICAPIVEETVYRGFLWRGLEASRLGRTGALLGTTVLFAAVHYNYFIANETFYPGTLAVYVVSGLLFGWMRWVSGNTTVPIIAHAFSNLAIPLREVLLSPWVP